MQPLTYLFEELAALQEADLEWSRVLLGASPSASGLRFPELLDHVPSELDDSSLYLLRTGPALESAEDFAGALAIWLKLCARWPQDCVGFSNGVGCLIRMGLWNRAETLLARAPEAYRHFDRYAVQKTQLEAKDADAAVGRTAEYFRGQPDLGGLLRSGIPSLDTIGLTADEDQPRAPRNAEEWLGSNIAADMDAINL